MMRFALGILLTPLLLSCSPDAPDKSKAQAAAPVDDACTVAVRFVDHWLHQLRGGRPVVFSDTPDITPNSPAPGPWFKLTGEYGEAPPAAMLANGVDRPRDSAVARCPALRAYLDRAKIPYGAKAVAAATDNADGDNAYPADILGLTLPSVSQDGTRALTTTSFQSGPLSGLGQFFLLKRQGDGGWPPISAQRLWIS
jgi:hypothetical protein